MAEDAGAVAALIFNDGFEGRVDPIPTGAPVDIGIDHQACDTFFNLNHTALDQMSDAAAHATWTLARSRSPITEAEAAKVKKGKRVKCWKYQGPFRVR